MSTKKKAINFFESEEGLEVLSTLKSMALDGAYNTQASYSANTVTYPDNSIPFVDKHMNYLRAHPATDPRQYLSNLRLMTRIK